MRGPARPLRGGDRQPGLHARPSSAPGWPRASRIDDIAEYLNLTALFRNQWGFRPEDGEDDAEFKERVRRRCASSWPRPRRPTCSCPRSPTATSPANAEGNDLVIWKDERRTVRVDAVHLPPPAQGAVAVHRRLLPPGRARASDDFASFSSSPSGRGSPRRRPGCSPRTSTRTTSSCTAWASRWPRPLAEYWHRRIREELGLRRRGRPHPDRPVPPAVPGRPLLVGLPGLPGPRGQRQGGRAARAATASASR